MRRMNGWLRIWVVLTVIWSILALGFGGLVLSEIRSPFARREAMVEIQCHPFVDGDQVDLVRVYGAEKIKAASAKQTASDRPEIQQDVDRCAEALKSDYEQAHRDEMRQDIGGTAAGWLMPPLIVLALGYAIAWILRGFRRPG